MKKITFITLFSLFVCSLNAQEKKYDTDYFRCENQWVLLPGKPNDTINDYGFIYLDRQAGFTFNYEGRYYIKDKKQLVLLPTGSDGVVKYRLKPNTVKVEPMSDSFRELLKLPKEPDWLSIYRKGEEEIDALIKRGYHYNHVGGSDLAIPILLKAYQKNPHAETLEFELSYAYNATEQFDKTIEVLDKAIKHDPKNFWFYRELGYAYVHLDKFAKAEEIYKKGISITQEKNQQAEMALNMTGAYYRTKNRKKFDEWLSVAKKYTDENSPYYEHLQKMEANFGKS